MLLTRPTPHGVLRMDAAPAFRFADLPPDDRDWLRRRTEDIQTLAYRTVCDHVRIGQIIAEAKDKLPARSFRGWVESELPFRRDWAYKLMYIATAVGPHVSPQNTQRIDTGALVLLSLPGSPPQALAYALQEAGDGKRVTVEDAREFIAEHRRKATPEEVQAHEERMEPIREKEKVERRAAMAGPDPEKGSRAWEALQQLATTATVVHISRVEDIEDDEDDDPPPFSVTAHFPDDRPRNVVRRSLADAVMALVEREEERWCSGCGESHPVSQFGENKLLPGGKARNCKRFERERMRELKKQKKAKRRADGGGRQDA